MDKVNSVFDVASRAMSAQMTRLNTIASNLANANTVASSSAEAYKALRPVFAAQFSEKVNKSGLATVGIEGIVALDRAFFDHRLHAGLLSGGTTRHCPRRH